MKLIFLLSSILVSQAMLNIPNLLSNVSLRNNIEGPLDKQDALLLTPLIQQGKIKEAQKLAEVKNLIPNIRSYSGYITVNEKYDTNLFFWYFPAIAAVETDAPLVIWLNGGPGCSSLYGLMWENGPIQVDKFRCVTRRDISWANRYNMLYVDQPMATGFSFTNYKGPIVDLEFVANDFYSLVQQFYRLFPFHRNTDLYISGESYSGQYIPAISHKIYEENKNLSLEDQIPLTGIAMGNGLYTFAYDNSQYFYQLGMDQNSNFNRYNVISSHGDGTKNVGYLEWLNSFSVKGAIHAINKDFQVLSSQAYCCQEGPDQFRFTKQNIETLLDAGFKVMIYNGHLDTVCPFHLQNEFLRNNLTWHGKDEYAKAKRIHWKVPGDTQVAGYVREVRNLRQVLVRGAGHMVPTDQPERAMDMMRRFIEGVSFKD